MARLIHETVLAMELDRSHIGKLVQIITDSWSMTGTLTRVGQHDNREWGIDYPARTLRPTSGEIYTVLFIGPWEGRVIGNQPVTVESVAGTLVAPERAWEPLPPLPRLQPFRPLTRFITDEEMEDARSVVEGTIVDPEGRDALAAKLEEEVRNGERTINSARAALGLPPAERGE